HHRHTLTTQPHAARFPYTTLFRSEQKKAVIHGNGPLLIVAGAGTGKTTVITRRIAWLILHKKLKANEILALTFTEKAAEEMETRDRKSTRLNSSHVKISYAVFC